MCAVRHGYIRCLVANQGSRDFLGLRLAVSKQGHASMYGCPHWLPLVPPHGVPVVWAELRRSESPHHTLAFLLFSDCLVLRTWYTHTGKPCRRRPVSTLSGVPQWSATSQRGGGERVRRSQGPNLIISTIIPYCVHCTFVQW